MDWIILFLVSWGLFIFLIDWKQLKVNIWSGILAVICQFSIDFQAINHGYYYVKNRVATVWNSSAFFVLGPVLVMGILIAQYYPCKRWAQIGSVFMFAILYSAQEYLLVSRKDVVYINWHYVDSLTVNLGVMIILAWFSIVVLKKGERSV
ncbi:MAG: hypothetical protein N2645_22400 [Clostridia bacterium]|nr:hypothetical protein [Clostridia bacterium]